MITNNSVSIFLICFHQTILKACSKKFLALFANIVSETLETMSLPFVVSIPCQSNSGLLVLPSLKVRGLPNFFVVIDYTRQSRESNPGWRIQSPKGSPVQYFADLRFDKLTFVWSRSNQFVRRSTILSSPNVIFTMRRGQGRDYKTEYEP